jgi:hypothetical protein
MNLTRKSMKQQHNVVLENRKHKDRSVSGNNHDKTSVFLRQLMIDLAPEAERLKFDAVIEEISPEDLRSFCKRKDGLGACEKMELHELKTEPVEKVISISRKDGKDLPEKDIKKILEDLGYNIDVLLSKKDSCCFDAVINIGGYSVLGWKKFVKLSRKINTDVAIFLGKSFAPGRSRLHLRLYRGSKNWYVIAHIDFNWVNWNLAKINRAHNHSGKGDYKTGNKCFVESLKKYFEL